MFNASEGRPGFRSPGLGGRGGRAPSAGWCGGRGENSLKLSRPGVQGPFSPAANHYPAPTSLSSVAQTFWSQRSPKRGHRGSGYRAAGFDPWEGGHPQLLHLLWPRARPPARSALPTPTPGLWYPVCYLMCGTFNMVKQISRTGSSNSRGHCLRSLQHQHPVDSKKQSPDLAWPLWGVGALQNTCEKPQAWPPGLGTLLGHTLTQVTISLYFILKSQIRSSQRKPMWIRPQGCPQTTEPGNISVKPRFQIERLNGNCFAYVMHRLRLWKRYFQHFSMPTSGFYAKKANC